MGCLNMLFVNLFYPERHPTIGFPLNVEALVGDLVAEYGDEVDACVLDMQQPGITVDNILDTLRDRRFDVLGISVKTGQRVIAENILDGVRTLSSERRPRHVMIGGYRPRVYHDEFVATYPEVLTCIGEGEPTMRGMVEHLRGNVAIEQIPNLVFAGRDGVVRTPRQQHDLRRWHPPGTSSLPFVLESGGVVYLETSRGCSWEKCTFCSRKFSSGTKPGAIPVKSVAESWAIVQNLGVRHVYCADEDFLMNSHVHGLELAEALLEAGVGIQFWVQTTVDGVLQLGRASHRAESERGESDGLPQAHEVLEMLRRAGLRQIFFGLESGSATQLLRYRKGVTAAEGARAVALCREVGLEVEAGLIPLDPLVSMDELRESVEYVRANDLARSIVKVLNLMCIQNGVAMFAKTKKAGLLLASRDTDTFLYPYKFADARAGQIADWIHAWNRHGLSEFTYALRRLVDANPSNPVSTQFLMELRELEFEYLATLVETPSTCDDDIHTQCMRRRLDIMTRCMEAVSTGRMSDPRGFLQLALDDSVSEGMAWMKPSETADVLRL